MIRFARFAAIIGLCVAAAGASVPTPLTMVDGDTVRLADGELVRLVGFNAPESGGRALCDAERRLGVIAKARLKMILDRGGADLEIVPCACRPGTEGTDRCNYGRACGILRSGGRDVADILIGEGLAVPFHCGRTSCPKLPRPWCVGQS